MDKKQERFKALQDAVSNLEKQFGKGSVMRLGDKPHNSYDVIPTGSMGLDMALGIGGLPRGRIVELYGPESSGKTTLSLHIIAEAQKLGGTCAFIDAEHALDTVYAKNLGVDIENLYLSQPDCGDDALEITDSLVKSGGVDIVVIDSVASLVPKAELEGDMGQSHMGLHARLMSQAMRKITGNINTSNTLLLCINQTRQKIGVMFGNPETTTGGMALKFYSSVRMKISRIGAIKNGEEVVGNKTKVEVKKNKVAPPFKKAHFDIIYGKGISRIGEIIDFGLIKGVLKKSGAWYFYGEEKFQGRDNFIGFLEENDELRNEIEGKIKC